MTNIDYVKIAIQPENNSLSIMTFLTKVRLYNGIETYVDEVEPTTENIEAEIRKAFGNTALSWQIVDEADIPTDRKYRAAWVLQGNSVVVDMTKAAELEMRTIREKRNELLAASDVYVLPDRWNTYTEEKQTEWAAYRQALRDLPETIEDPFNPIWPSMPRI